MRLPSRRGQADQAADGDLEFVLGQVYAYAPRSPSRVTRVDALVPMLGSAFAYLAAAIWLVPALVESDPYCACCHDCLMRDDRPPLCEKCAPGYTVYGDGSAFCDWHEPTDEAGAEPR